MTDAILAELRSTVAKLAATGTPMSRAALSDQGLLELFQEDLPPMRRAFFEEQGRTLLASPAVDAAAMTAGGHGSSWLRAAIAYPATLTPGPDPDRLTGISFYPDPDETAEIWFVRHPDPATYELATVPAASCVIQPVQTLDQSLRLSLCEADPRAVAGSGVDEGWAAAAIASAWRSFAHELVGVSEQMIALAVDHVSVRAQFGRPIGANQAVQHSLVTADVDVVSAAAFLADTEDDTTVFASMCAKALASRAFKTTSGSAQQALGAIGFTWEHPFHRYLRRGLVLDRLLGTMSDLECEIGAELVRGGARYF